MKIQRAIKTTRLFIHAVWTNLSPPSKIERMQLNRTGSIKRRFIGTVDCNASVRSTVTPNFLFKYTVLRERKLALRFSRLIELFRHHNSSGNQFPCILDSFAHPRSAGNRNLIERSRRNHILNFNFVFKNAN